MQNKQDDKAPFLARLWPGGLNFGRLGRWRLPALIAGGIAAFALIALIAVNLLISADWVRERVASRIKEQTGRDLKVNGSTALLFTPGPHIVITDATITDPEARAGTADIKVARLAIDLSFGELLSRRIDAQRVVLVRPVLTMRLGSGPGAVRRSDAGPDKPKTLRFMKAETGAAPSRRELRLSDVRIEDGTIKIFYDDDGTERRVEHIDAKLSLPSSVDPLTGTGKFDWKGQTVEFGLELTSPADLRQARPARLVLALDTQAIAARFDGKVVTRPGFSGEGKLSAKAHSIPSLLAWMRETPPAATGIGDGELASQLSWTESEIKFSKARFALEHASGQGEAVVTLRSPRPHVRAALALDHLDLNPFLSSSATRAAASVAARREGQETSATAPAATPRTRNWFSNPEPAEDAPGAETELELSPPAATGSTPSAPGQAAPVSPAPSPVASPASFDADVNLNVRKTRVAHLDLGPSSVGFAFRDGVLDATLGGVELYDGQGSGKLVLDVNKPVPTFTGDFRLDGVQARPLLSDAAQFSLLSGRTKLALQLSGVGTTAEEIKASLQGQGNVALSDGSIEGIDLTEVIAAIGAGEIPNFRQRAGAKTSFSDLGGSFTITDGVAETSNLQMLSPLLKVKAAGTVDLKQDSLDILAQPEIVAGPEGRGGANELAGLTIPVRIEGPLAGPRIKPEIKGMFSSPEQAGRTVNQIGEALQKKFKGKPVGEALGRFLGNVQIGPHGEGNGAAPPLVKRRGAGTAPSQATPPPSSAEQGDAESADPELDDILR